MGDMDDAIGQVYNSNNNEILNRLNQCISTGSGTLGGSVSVGFYDQTAQDKLVGIIIKALKNRDNNELTESINKIPNTVKKGIDDFNASWLAIAKKYINDQKNKELKSTNVLDKLILGVGKRIPILGKAINAGYGFLKLVYNQQKQWVLWYQELNSSGILLSEGLDQLTNYANDAGVKIGDFVSILTQHSKTVAKFGAIYGDGAKATSKFLNKITPIGDELGYTESELHKVSMSFADRYGIMYSMQKNNMDELTQKTSNYLKFLTALSRATGVQKEQIEEENKQRENDIRWNIWLKANPLNAMKAAIWTRQGYNLEQQRAMAFHMPNKEYQKLLISDRNAVVPGEMVEKAKTEEELQEIVKNEIPEFLEKLREENIKNIKELANSPILLAQPEIVEFYASGQMLINNLLGIKWDEFKKVFDNKYSDKEKSDKELLKSAREKEREIAKIQNDIADTLKLSSDTIEAVYRSEKMLYNEVKKDVETLKKKLLDPIKGVGEKGVKFGIENTTQALVDTLGNIREAVEGEQTATGAFWKTITEHPIFSTGLVLLGLSWLPRIFRGITLIWGIGSTLWKGIKFLLWTLPSRLIQGFMRLGPWLARTIGIAIKGGAIYEALINGADFIERGYEGLYHQFRYGTDRLLIGVKDFFNGYKSEEEHQKAIEISKALYEDEINQLDNTPTYVQKYIPGIYLRDGSIRKGFGNEEAYGYLQNMFNDNNEERNNILKDIDKNINMFSNSNDNNEERNNILKDIDKSINMFSNSNDNNKLITQAKSSEEEFTNAIKDMPNMIDQQSKQLEQNLLFNEWIKRDITEKDFDNEKKFEQLKNVLSQSYELSIEKMKTYNDSELLAKIQNLHDEINKLCNNTDKCVSHLEVIKNENIINNSFTHQIIKGVNENNTNNIFRTLDNNTNSQLPEQSVLGN